MSFGDDAAQVRRLDHMVARHGVVIVPCACDGAGCANCSGLGVEFVARPDWAVPCGPSCPFHEGRPQ